LPISDFRFDVRKHRGRANVAHFLTLNANGNRKSAIGNGMAGNEAPLLRHLDCVLAKTLEFVVSLRLTGIAGHL
jgi:hypothetical protein